MAGISNENVASDATLDGYKRLAYAIVIQGFKDLKSDKVSEQLDAFDFITNDAGLWLATLSDSLIETSDLLYKACNYRGKKI